MAASSELETILHVHAQMDLNTNMRYVHMCPHTCAPTHVPTHVQV